jgi:site-specific DNA-methyltransferase (adenine-specific)
MPRRSPEAARSLRAAVEASLAAHFVAILPPLDVLETLLVAPVLGTRFDVTMLDPWYNRGFGGTRPDYIPFCLDMIRRSASVSDHVFFWGFPDVVAPLVERIPSPLALTAWLTWFYKNNPSVSKGWRESQQACLHLSGPEAALFSGRFLNERQKALADAGKLRYVPGPTTVIESAALVGFIRRAEQTGHPSQKPVTVYRQLLKMAVADNGTVLDPMCGSGTTGAAARDLGFMSVLCDGSPSYLELAERRLGVERLDVSEELSELRAAAAAA